MFVVVLSEGFKIEDRASGFGVTDKSFLLAKCLPVFFNENAKLCMFALCISFFECSAED